MPSLSLAGDGDGVRWKLSGYGLELADDIFFVS